MEGQLRTAQALAEAEAIMLAAVDRCGGRAFIRKCFFLLWPSGKTLLTELSRRLGSEIRLPRDKFSLLSRCIMAGAENFRENQRLAEKERVLGDPRTWDLSVYLWFLAPVFQCAAVVGNCQAAANGNTWTIEGPAYLDWRRENPGRVQILWRWGREPLITAVELASQVLDAAGHKAVWAGALLLESLAEGGRAAEEPGDGC